LNNNVLLGVSVGSVSGHLDLDNLHAAQHAAWRFSTTTINASDGYNSSDTIRPLPRTASSTTIHCASTKISAIPHSSFAIVCAAAFDHSTHVLMITHMISVEKRINS
jgi:hypothetical protein